MNTQYIYRVKWNRPLADGTKTFAEDKFCAEDIFRLIICMKEAKILIEYSDIIYIEKLNEVTVL